MNQINLIPFAEHSQKLPSKFVAPHFQKEQTATTPLLISHFIDFILAFAFLSFMGAMYNLAMYSFMVTPGLKKSFAATSVFGLSPSLLPLMVFTYFFFSYFMNHGQTFGMLIVKARVKVEDRNVKECLRWAMFSTFLCFSCGISYLFQKEKWLHFKQHDYLYGELIGPREEHAVNLISLVESKPSEETVEEEMSIAA